MDISEKSKLKRDKFVLLAKVGHAKRKASQYQDEAVFYFGIATELLAITTELAAIATGKQVKLDTKERLRRSELTSRFHRLTKQLLNYWPPSLESQEMYLDWLNSDGAGTLLATTGDGFVSLSSDLILKNVESIFAATKERCPNP